MHKKHCPLCRALDTFFTQPIPCASLLVVSSRLQHPHKAFGCAGDQRQPGEDKQRAGSDTSETAFNEDFLNVTGITLPGRQAGRQVGTDSYHLALKLAPQQDTQQML